MIKLWGILYFGALLLLLIWFLIWEARLLFFVLLLGGIGLCILYNLRPKSRLIYGLLVLTLAGIVESLLDKGVLIWWFLLTSLVILSLLDILILFSRIAFSIERILPSKFAIGQSGQVQIRIHNESRLGCYLSIFDGLPSGGECRQLPWFGFIAAGDVIEVEYDLILKERGWIYFTRTHVEVFGPLRFWSRLYRKGGSEKVRVYPDYKPFIDLAMLSMESNSEKIGIIKKARSGLSKEFHQLRDYHEGDPLSQIDWKASSKRQSLISREYQEQRDQNVILALDCSRRMRALDGGISQFDHCLNAIVLLAYVALKQGDNVGIMAFGGQDYWLPPCKGVHSMTQILNHLFEYKTSYAPSDYAEAVEKLLVRQRRRSMIVFISNLRGEDTSELFAPIEKLRRRHIVTIANIRETEVHDAFQREVTSFEDAVRLAALQKYLEERELVTKQLQEMDIPSVDTIPALLPVAMSNQYLAHREMV